MMKSFAEAFVGFHNPMSKVRKDMKNLSEKLLEISSPVSLKNDAGFLPQELIDIAERYSNTNDIYKKIGCLPR